MSKPSVIFSSEDHERILELVKDGRTIKSIADEFGVSPRSIQRYLNKQGIETAATKDREKNKQRALQELLDRSKVIRDNEKRERERRVSTTQPSPPRDILDPTPIDYNMRLITLEQKKQYDCGWIIGDPKREYRYCGNSTIGIGGPYCEYHKNISRNKQPQMTTRPHAPVNQK